MERAIDGNWAVVVKGGHATARTHRLCPESRLLLYVNHSPAGEWWRSLFRRTAGSARSPSPLPALFLVLEAAFCMAPGGQAVRRASRSRSRSPSRSDSQLSGALGARSPSARALPPLTAGRGGDRARAEGCPSAPPPGQLEGGQQCCHHRLWWALENRVESCGAERNKFRRAQHSGLAAAAQPPREASGAGGGWKKQARVSPCDLFPRRASARTASPAASPERWHFKCFASTIPRLLNEKKPRMICKDESQSGERLILPILPQTLSSPGSPRRQKPAPQFALMLRTPQGLCLLERRFKTLMEWVVSRKYKFSKINSRRNRKQQNEEGPVVLPT